VNALKCDACGTALPPTAKAEFEKTIAKFPQALLATLTLTAVTCSPECTEKLAERRAAN
jgi:hypothetical protein